MLEDQDEQPIGGAHRQQVEHDRLDRDDQRAEGHQQQQEREPEHEREHARHAGLHLVVEVVRARGPAGHGVIDAGTLAECRGSKIVRRVAGAAIDV